MYYRKTKKYNQFTSSTRVYLKELSPDGFGIEMSINLNEKNVQIGSIVYRIKTYLSDLGYSKVLEIHLGFEEEFQKQGYFKDTLIELYNAYKIPLWLAYGRIINHCIHKAVAKLNPENVIELENGYIITF